MFKDLSFAASFSSLSFSFSAITSAPFAFITSPKKPTRTPNPPTGIKGITLPCFSASASDLTTTLFSVVMRERGGGGDLSCSLLVTSVGRGVLHGTSIWYVGHYTANVVLLVTAANIYHFCSIYLFLRLLAQVARRHNNTQSTREGFFRGSKARQYAKTKRQTFLPMKTSKGFFPFLLLPPCSSVFIRSLHWESQKNTHSRLLQTGKPLIKDRKKILHRRKMSRFFPSAFFFVFPVWTVCFSVRALFPPSQSALRLRLRLPNSSI